MTLKPVDRDEGVVDSRTTRGPRRILRAQTSASTRNRPRFLRFLVVAAALQLVPGMMSGSHLITVNLACVYAIAAIGLNVIFGLGGMISVGQAGLMALGSYGLVLTFGESVGLAVAILIGCVLGAAASVGMGLLGARVKTHYFILASLAVAEIIVLVATNETDLTGGANGAAVLGAPTVFGLSLLDPAGFYAFASVLVIVAAYLIDGFYASRWGVALSAMTMNEHMALASGVSPQAARFVATAVGGALAGLSGAMLALLNGYIGPHDFALGTAALLLLIVVVAGRERQGSVVAAALLLTFLSQGLLTLQAVGQLVYGLGLILLLVFAPDGLAGASRWFRTQVRALLRPARRAAKGATS